MHRQGYGWFQNRYFPPPLGETKEVQAMFQKTDPTDGKLGPEKITEVVRTFKIIRKKGSDGRISYDENQTMSKNHKMDERKY